MDTKITIVALTEKAAAKVREFIAAEPEPESTVLRMEVQPGGCAGFRYGLFFDDVVADSDIVEEVNGVRVAVDPMSAEHLRGVIIDWKESLSESGFVVENPNSKASCACGDSFQ